VIAPTITILVAIAKVSENLYLMMEINQITHPSISKQQVRAS
jgi:hypothetical protein